jgi:23S rRNA pseudouridine2457 synthase
MTAAIGHPTLRLIRYAIGPWTLDGLLPGTWNDAPPPRLPPEPSPRTGKPKPATTKPPRKPRRR